MLTKTIRPAAELDFVFDWGGPAPGPWLATGESIASSSCAVEGVAVKLSDATAGGAVTAWVRCNADAPAGAQVSIRCSIVTSAGRKDSRRIDLVVTR